MNLVSFLGALGTLLGLVRALPQLIRLLRKREAYGVSVDTAATSSIVGFGWAAYGIMTNQPFVSFATGSSGTIFALIAFFALRFGRQVREFKISPLWLGALILVGFLGGRNGLGIFLPISVLAANIPQLLVAYQEGNLMDLSLGTWLLSTSDGLIWGGYALIQSDFPILLYAIFQMATSGLIVGLIARNKGKMKSNVSP